MAQFPNRYFEGEIREGFFVESMMKRAWAAQIEVLEMIDRVCAKYGICYFGDWGTLLGAVRHKGFIPWDDDIDIAMKRADYMRFLSIARTELEHDCSLLSMYTEESYRQFFARVVNSREISLEKEHMERYHGCPYVVGVDIFPLDRLPADKKEKEVHCKMIQILYDAMDMCCGGMDALEEQLRQIEILCHVKIDRGKNIQNQLMRLTDQVFQIYNDGDGDITQFIYYLKKTEYHMPGECYQDVILLPFETIEIPVPKDYDTVLSAMYGDWHQFVRGVGHAYPFYREQEEILKKRLEQESGAECSR